MKRFVVAAGLTALVLSGCDSGGNEVSRGSESAAPGGSSAPAIQDATLRVRFDFTDPAEATRFTLQVLDPIDGRSLAGPLEFQRQPGQPVPEQVVPGIDGSFFRVVVSTADADGHPFGTLDQTIVANSRDLQVVFSALPLALPTREIGRISTGALPGDSNEPDLSADGRFVAFSSVNPGLVSNLQSDTRRAIYVRDRQLGVTRRLGRFQPGTTVSLTDGTSNTILQGEGGAINCSDPDISADGRFVVYQGDKNGTQVVQVDRQAFGNELLLSPASATLGTDFVTIQTGLHPSISDDGRFVAYVAGVAGGPNQIALYDRESQSTTLISKSPGGLRADKACVGPVLSGDGNLLFFSSNASNLVGGQGGLFVYDLRTEVMTRLGNPSAFPCAVSSDGRFVAANVDNRLRLIDRQNNTNVEVPGLVAFVPLGAPALSGDGRFLTFYSNRADLVTNDANKQTDVFVLDLLTQRISRVNLSGDGVATQGGVDALLTQGPAISRDGTRIAFASADELLVPNDSNRSIDVFSSSNPTGGKLYVATSTGRILRFDNVAGANGALTAAATLTSPLLTGSPRVELFLDTFNDRLYAAAGTLSNSRLLVFDNVSTLNGDVVPRFRAIGASFPGLFVDVANDLLYRGNTLFSGAAALGGPVRTLSAERPTQILVDSRFNEWMLGQGGSVRVFPAGLSSASTPTRILPGTGATSCGLQFDVSPPGTTGFNNSNLFVLGEGPALGSTPDAGLNSLVHLSRTGSLLHTLRGTQTQLGNFSSASDPGPIVTDPYSGHLYCATGSDNRILVFHKPTQSDGDVPPDRILTLPFQPTSFALDRTR